MASKTKQEESETMEEVMNSMKHACEVARNLESELPNMANQPQMLSLSIDEVLQAFNGAKERLLMMMMMMLSQQDQTITASSFAPMLSHHDATQQAQMGATTAMQKLLIGSGSYTDQLFQMQQPNFDARVLIENKMIGGVDLQQLRYNNRSTLQIGEMGGRDVEGSARSMGSEGDHVHKIEASSSPRPRKSRKNEPGRNTIMVPAPQVGNTEVPPEDGCTWRKYGQKEILGSKYPRGYFRCTHQKLYACPAKKQVQRLDHNPNMLEVTYRGEHTCHMSSTAPSASFHPPQLLVNAMTQSTISSQLSPSSTSVSGWLSSVNLSLCGGGMAPTGAGASNSAGPSTSRYGTDNYLVADMADVMFNSASSSGNDSMESLFPPTEDK